MVSKSCKYVRNDSILESRKRLQHCSNLHQKLGPDHMNLSKSENALFYHQELGPTLPEQLARMPWPVQAWEWA